MALRRGPPGRARGTGSGTPASRTSTAAADLASAAAMRCGGCGSKVASVVLHRVLGRLPPAPHPDVLIGFGGGEDAAVLRVPPGKLLVQSVDHFRTFLDDPWLFGRIAAHHCLSDLFAMGAEPRTAQAMVTLPFARPDKVEQDLFDLLSGVTETLSEAGAALVGGHTAEGPECAARPHRERPLRHRPPQGGGRGRRPAVPHEAARHGGRLRRRHAGRSPRRDGGTRPSRRCSAPMRRRPASCAPAGRPPAPTSPGSACSDIWWRCSGQAGRTRSWILPPCRACKAPARSSPGGVRSSLHEANAAFGAALDGIDPHDPRAALLYDPQTSGGLLASVPAERADECASALAAAGCGAAARIGTIVSASPPGGRVRVRT